MDVAIYRHTGACIAGCSDIKCDPGLEHAARQKPNEITPQYLPRASTSQQLTRVNEPEEVFLSAPRQPETDPACISVFPTSIIVRPPKVASLRYDGTGGHSRLAGGIALTEKQSLQCLHSLDLLNAEDKVKDLQASSRSSQLGNSIYSRLFIIVVLLNIISMSIFWRRNLPLDLWCEDSTQTTILTAYMTTAFAINLTACIILRHDHFINCLYRCLTSKTGRAPLWLRRHLASVYCMGGVHSGCATAALVWYVATVAFAIANAATATLAGIQSLIISIIALVTFLIIIIFSLPAIRKNHHNTFELTHRFGGWTLLLLLWLQILLPAVQADLHEEDGDQPNNPWWQSPPFWLLFLSTILIAYPWIRLRRVDVRAEQMSTHAIRLMIPLQVRPCRIVRISHSPIIESHPFAAIPEPDQPGWSSIIVSRAGDWTSRIIEDTSAKLWIRETPTWGVIRVALLFKSVAVITTGSGIGPCLSLFVGHPDLPCRVLWSTRNPEKTYGSGVLDLVRRTDPMAHVIDTNQSGRLDMVRLSLAFYRMSGAEAVIVISNPELTRRIVAAFVQRGIAAYGPIWDS